MKIGVKTYDKFEFLNHFKDKCDFYEIMAIETNDYSFVKKLDKKIKIHSQHRRFNINNSDKSNYIKNLSSINFARKIADLSNADQIIIHPGEITNEFCSLENSIEFFKKINDKRIIVENMPIDKMKRLCEFPNEVKEFMKETKVGFCLDLNHAIQTAIPQKLDYIDFIKEFIKLKPVHYHIGGQVIKKNIEHCRLRGSDIDFESIIKILPNDAELTLETETSIDSVEDDINILRGLINDKKTFR